MTTNITELEQQLAEARRREQERTEQEAAASRDRETAFRRQRLKDHNPAALAQATRAAHGAFIDALEADPVFSAFAEATAARWREHRARLTAHDDRAYLARIDGTTVPHDPGTTEPPSVSAEALIAAVSNMVADRVQAHSDAIDKAFAGAVFGEGLTPEQVLEAEAAAEAERRRQAAQSVVSGSTDVTGMSDADREALGLPSGSSRKDSERF